MSSIAGQLEQAGQRGVLVTWSPEQSEGVILADEWTDAKSARAFLADPGVTQAFRDAGGRSPDETSVVELTMS